MDVGGSEGAVMTEDEWHTPLVHVRGGELRGDTGQTPGMQRLEAISGRNAGSAKIWMGQTRVAPLAKSGDHHYGGWQSEVRRYRSHRDRQQHLLRKPLRPGDR